MDKNAAASRPNSAPRFQIRPMSTAADREGRAFVHYTAWQETYPGLMDPRILAAKTLERCRETAERCPDNTLVAVDTEQENQVVGFLCYYPEARPFASVPESSEISALYVLRAFQGFGLGRMLVEQALTLLPHPRATLFVLKGNKQAIGFYQHIGFRFTGHELTQQLCGAELSELEMVLERRVTSARNAP